MRHMADNAAAQASGAAKVGMPARLRCLTACGALGAANTTTGLSVRAKQSRNGPPTVSGSVIEDEPENDGNRIVGRAFEHAVDYIAKVLGFHAREGNVDGVSIQHRIGNIQSL